MSGGVVIVNWGFEIETGCGGSQTKGACVFFFLGLELFNAPGIGSGANQQETGGQWIKCARMTYLYFAAAWVLLRFEVDLYESLDFVDCIKGGPTQGFINQ